MVHVRAIDPAREAAAAAAADAAEARKKKAEESRAVSDPLSSVLYSDPEVGV